MTIKSGSRTIVWLNEIGKDDVALVGGKGANLGELTRLGVPVPSAFIVTADAYFRFLDETGLRRQIKSALAGLDHNNTSILHKTADRIKSLIINADMPDDIAREIRAAYSQMGEGPVAVRSSATAEDLPEASFAGQQATFLNVVGAAAVIKAVQRCWASLFEARAIFYRAQGGYDDLKVGIAVPVQHMVQSETSGVMFTVEPVTSDRSKIVIEAVFGLGEAIVSGEITPDHYVVDKASLRLTEKMVVVQNRKLVRSDDPDAAEPNMWVDVPTPPANRQKLADRQIIELAKIGLKVEQHYGHPQDIEWAMENGNLYLVQTRPVTTLREPAAAEEEEPEPAPVLLRGAAASPGVAYGRVKIVNSPSEIDKVEEGDVLVAEMTTPDFVPAMKRAAAIVTDRGGRTCHAAIVSRELGVACVVGTGNATRELTDGYWVTVDGARGVIYQGRAKVRLAWAERERARQAAISDIETNTRVYVNLAEPELADVVAKLNVDGVGLLRAEFMIAQIGEHPRLALEQGRASEFIARLADGLEKFAKAFHPRPVVYRTTDFKTNEYHNLKGGDKYEPFEENPMIGFRGAARYIRDPDVFRLELDAIKLVRERYNNLWVMIPFVRTPDELRKVKDLMAESGLVQTEDFKLWMMAEVPSNVFIIDKFIDVGIDGISIGSNDLTQLTLGIDRDNATFPGEFDERNEAVMVALEHLVKAAKRRGITCSICGQAPSDYPDLTAKLVEWGITSVSINRDAIAKTREIIAAAEGKLTSARA